MTTQLDGQFDLTSANEDEALPGATDVASFTDANQTDTASAFTVTIDWGDGSTTPGTVVGSNGSFTVEGGHTYADEGNENVSATIVRTADSSQLVLSGNIPVDDTDNLTGHSAPTISGSPNQALTNVTVATFTDTNTSNVASDFTVSIDWGDGTTTGGTLSGGGGTFSVSGSHTYATAGDFTITTFMNDDFPEAATGVATTTAAMGFGGTETLQSATEFTPISSGTEVAVFVDNSGLPAGDYTAAIDWGDGATTSGTVSGSNGSFTVTTAGHTYADEGLFTLTANVERTTDSATTAASGTVTVADADVLNVSGTTIHSPNQTLTNVMLATFSDLATQNVASDFVATIDWGDGTTDTGTISGANGAFTVSGSHTYAQNGQDIINVDVAEDPTPGVPTASAEATSTAVVGLAPGTGADFNVLEGTPLPSASQVATFLDGNISDTASAFSATIDWGDGTTDAGTISGSNGSFTVTVGDHTYADEGNDTITTTVTRTADNAQAVVTGQVAVGDADSFVVTTDNFSANPGQSLNNVQVATFTDAFTGQVASDLTATISWGDGTTSAGTIAGGGGSFSVLGSHTYTNGGDDTFTVTVADDPPGTATASATGTTTINLPVNPATPPAGTTADLIMDRPSTGDYEIYDFGNNTVLAAQPLTEISAPWRVVGLGSFNGGDTSDMLLRNTTTGSFEIVDVSNNNAGAPVLLGNVGLELTVAGFGDFSSQPGETDMMMRNTNSGDLVLYDFRNNAVPFSTDLGNVGLEVQVFGFGDFSGNPNETDMLMRNVNTGNLVLYELGNNQVTSVTTLGSVGPEWQFAGAGDFSGNPGETDMLTRNANTGDFELYDFQNGKIVSATALGNVGLEEQVAGFGDFSSNPDETDMLLRNMNNGNFELFDFHNNAAASVTMLGNVGLEWRVDGTAPYQLTGSAAHVG